MCYREYIIKYLRNWLEQRNSPDKIPYGKGSRKNKDGEYPQHCHILPLECDAEAPKEIKKEAKIAAINKYNILVDGVRLNCIVLPSLHGDAHHLNSSQIMCYNFFGSFLDVNDALGKVLNVTPALNHLLYKLELPDMSGGKCQFEYVMKGERTSFDFCVWTDEKRITFEIKLTEPNFSGGSDSKTLEERFYKTTYAEMFSKESTIVGEPADIKPFIMNLAFLTRRGCTSTI